MEDVLKSALDAARVLGASFAEARTVDERSENYEVKNGKPAHASSGVHVLVAVIACGALLSAERFQRTFSLPYEEKWRAKQ